MEQLIAQEQRESDKKLAKVQYLEGKSAMLFMTAVP